MYVRYESCVSDYLFFKNKRYLILPHLHNSHLEETHIMPPRALNPKENLCWSSPKLEITGFTSVPAGGGVAVILILQRGKKKKKPKTSWRKYIQNSVYSDSKPCLRSFEILSRQGFRNFLTLHAHSHLSTWNQETLSPKSQSKSVTAASRAPERWKLLKVSALETPSSGHKNLVQWGSESYCKLRWC